MPQVTGYLCSREHKQENPRQRKQNSRITETRFLFRYGTWNYLQRGDTPKGGHQGITSNVHKSWQEYHQLKWGQRYCFWLTAVSGPLKDEIRSFQQGNSMLWRRTSPQNYWIWPAGNLPSMSKFYLQVPAVEVSNSRSLCLKTRKHSQEVIELLSISLTSGKGMWKKIRQVSEVI